MVVASGLLALVVGAAFLVLFFSIRDLRDAARDSRHSLEVLAAANRLERLVVDLETGQRGFLITHEERFLEPWAAARTAFPDVSGELNRLAAVPAQDRRARQITEAVASYIRDYSVPLVEAARRNDPSPTTVAATDEGKRRVDALRIQFDGFIAAERNLGAARQERSDAATRRAVIGAATGIGGSIFLIVLYAGYLTRAIVRPVRRAAVTAGRLAGGDLAARMPETGGGEIRALEHSFNTMGSSLEASRDELIRLADEQSALRRVATLVANGVPAPELFSAVTEELGRLIGADIAALVRLEPGNTAIVVGAWSDQEGNDVPVGTVIPLEGDTAATRLFRTGRPARSDNSDQIPGPVAALVRGLGVTSTVGTPIVVEGRLWGGISASSKQPEPLPADTESRIADFAELVATAIANAEARTSLPRPARASSPPRTKPAGDSSATCTMGSSSGSSPSRSRCGPRRRRRRPS